jgi:hypothetical protein
MFVLQVKTKGKMQDSQDKETSTDEIQSKKRIQKIIPLGA